MDTKKMKCNFCGKTVEFKKCGFSPNERWECSNCQAVFVPLESKILGDYSNYPSWISHDKWISNLQPLSSV